MLVFTRLKECCVGFQIYTLEAMGYACVSHLNQRDGPRESEQITKHAETGLGVPFQRAVVRERSEATHHVADATPLACRCACSLAAATGSRSARRRAWGGHPPAAALSPNLQEALAICNFRRLRLRMPLQHFVNLVPTCWLTSRSGKCPTLSLTVLEISRNVEL